MADNLGYTPGSGATVATDDIDGKHHQRVKLVLGSDGVSEGDVSAANPMPVAAPRAEDLMVMLSRIVKLLESNAVVDAAQRQRVTVDSITGALTLATVTTVGTVSTITAGTLTAVNNVVANAGMDREQYINVARNAYANSIRSQLTFV